MIKRIRNYVLILACVLFACLFCMQITDGKNKGVQAEESTSSYFYIKEGSTYRSMWLEAQCGIRYTGVISKSKIEEFKNTNGLDDATVKLLVVPYDFVTGLGNSNVSAFDEAKALIQAGKFVEGFETARKKTEFWYGIVDNVGMGENGEEYVLEGGIKSINDYNMNRRYFGIYYLEGTKTGDTEVIREYAKIKYTDGTLEEVSLANSGSISNSMAYMVTSIDLGEMVDWGLEHVNTFLKKSIIDGVKKSLSAEEKANVAEEEIKSKDVNDIIEVELTNPTYGDDYFEYKVYGLNINNQGTSEFIDVTSKLDMYSEWAFDNANVKTRVVKGLNMGQKGAEITAVAENVTATVTLGLYEQTIINKTIDVLPLDIATETEKATVTVEVADYSADRATDIANLGIVANVKISNGGGITGPIQKRLLPLPQRWIKKSSGQERQR